MKQTYKVVRVYHDHPRAVKINGYLYVKEHILIAEKALGKYLNIKHVVHHIDENKRNNKNTNLVICENENYHRLLHARMRIVKVRGNPDLHKICSFCCVLKFRSEFCHRNEQKSNRNDLLDSKCNTCKSKRDRRKVKK